VTFGRRVAMVDEQLFSAIIIEYLRKVYNGNGITIIETVDHIPVSLFYSERKVVRLQS
jgi:hypothetical protein